MNPSERLYGVGHLEAYNGSVFEFKIKVLEQEPGERRLWQMTNFIAHYRGIWTACRFPTRLPNPA